MGSGAQLISMFINGQRQGREQRQGQAVDRSAREWLSEFQKADDPTRQQLLQTVSQRVPDLPTAVSLADFAQKMPTTQDREYTNRLKQFEIGATDLAAPSQMPKTFGQMPTRQELTKDLAAFASDQGIRPADSQAVLSKLADFAPLTEAQKYQLKETESGLTYFPEAPGVPVPTGYRAPAGGQSGGIPYYTPVPTGDGVISFNNRDGTGTPLTVDGRPVIRESSDPELQRRLAAGKAGGKIAGETTEQSRIDLPQNVQDAEYTISLVDDLLAHPGFSQAVGKSSMLGVQKLPGTSAKDFMIRQEQLMGKQFLQAFESLKGGGQITEVEGKKATDAMSRMNNAGTEEGYRAAAKEFQSIIRLGVERAKVKAAGGSPQRGATGEWGQPSNAPRPGTVQDGYRFLGGNPADQASWERVR